MKVKSIFLASFAFGARFPIVGAENLIRTGDSNGDRVKTPTRTPTKQPTGPPTEQPTNNPIATGYHIWAADQSNSAPGQTALGVKGGFLWVFDSVDIDIQLAGGVDAKPLPCSPTATVGPCDVLTIFPPTLINTSGEALNVLAGFGRLHGAVPSHDGRYINVNMVSCVKLALARHSPHPASILQNIFKVHTRRRLRWNHRHYDQGSGGSLPSDQFHL